MTFFILLNDATTDRGTARQEGRKTLEIHFKLIIERKLSIHIASK